MANLRSGSPCLPGHCVGDQRPVRSRLCSMRHRAMEYACQLAFSRRQLHACLTTHRRLQCWRFGPASGRSHRRTSSCHPQMPTQPQSKGDPLVARRRGKYQGLPPTVSLQNSGARKSTNNKGDKCRPGWCPAAQVSQRSLRQTTGSV
jgi:hypothetical protein